MKHLISTTIAVLMSAFVFGQSYQVGGEVKKTNNTSPVVYSVKNSGSAGAGIIVIDNTDTCDIVYDDGVITISSDEWQIGNDSIYWRTFNDTVLGGAAIQIGTELTLEGFDGYHSGLLISDTYLNMGGGFQYVGRRASLGYVDPITLDGSTFSVQNDKKLKISYGNLLNPTTEFQMDESVGIMLTDTNDYGSASFAIINKYDGRDYDALRVSCSGDYTSINANDFFVQDVDGTDTWLQVDIPNGYSRLGTIDVEVRTVPADSAVYIGLGNNAGLTIEQNAGAEYVQSIDFKANGYLQIGLSDNADDYFSFSNDSSTIQMVDGYDTDKKDVKFHIYDVAAGEDFVQFDVSTRNIYFNDALVIDDGTQANGAVLTSNANGRSSWTALSALDFSTIPSYADRATAEAALGVGFLFLDESADKALKVTE